MSHIKRHTRHRLLKALNVSPVVFLNGPRQAGKSTLVQSIAKKDYPAEYVTFDSTTQMAAAANSPESYLKERKGALIIDEVQLVPEIFRALKIVVDELRLEQPKLKGRFLLTGSANIMALPKLSDPLVGRMSVLTLYPLAASEALAGDGNFIEKLFNKEFEPDSAKYKLAEVMRLATYPEISGSQKLERTTWFDGYLTTILQRDVRAIAEIEKLSTLPNLLRILANRAGGLVNSRSLRKTKGADSSRRCPQSRSV